MEQGKLFTVKVTSDKKLKRGQFSLIAEPSILAGGIGTKIISISFKTCKLRVWKLEKSESLRKKFKSILFAIFAI